LRANIGNCFELTKLEDRNKSVFLKTTALARIAVENHDSQNNSFFLGLKSD